MSKEDESKSVINVDAHTFMPSKAELYGQFQGFVKYIKQHGVTVSWNENQHMNFFVKDGEVFAPETLLEFAVKYGASSKLNEKFTHAEHNVRLFKSKDDLSTMESRYNEAAGEAFLKNFIDNKTLVDMTEAQYAWVNDYFDKFEAARLKWKEITHKAEVMAARDGWTGGSGYSSSSLNIPMGLLLGPAGLFLPK